MVQNDIVMFEIGRHRLAKLDLSLFLERYEKECWPTGSALRRKMGSLVMTFHGFDHDKREIHCIPEVRAYVKEFRRVWPYWLFFLCPEPEVSSLPVLMACCIERVNVLQVEGAPQCAIDFDPKEVGAVLTEMIPAFRTIADQANVFPKLRRQHLSECYALFGLRPEIDDLHVAGAMD